VPVARTLRRIRDGHDEGRSGERESAQAGRRLSARTSAVPPTRGGRSHRVERRVLAEWRMRLCKAPEVRTRGRRDVAEQPHGRGRERSDERDVTVTVCRPRSGEEEMTNDDASGLPGRPARQEPLAGRGRAELFRSTTCGRGRFDTESLALRGRRHHEPREQRDERQRAGARDAHQTHREDALQPSSSRSRSEFAAHDSTYPADHRKVPADDACRPLIVMARIFPE
jgi:hypothetical protein